MWAMMDVGEVLVRYTLRVAKGDAALVYFRLEANEGLCSYSTLEGTPGEGYRDLLIVGHPSLRRQIEYVLGGLERDFCLRILRGAEGYLHEDGEVVGGALGNLDK